MEKVIESEEVILDSKRLKTWQKEIQMIDNTNTNKAIEERVDEYINNNKKLTQKEVDNFIDFLDYCKDYYMNK